MLNTTKGAWLCTAVLLLTIAGACHADWLSGLTNSVQRAASEMQAITREIQSSPIEAGAIASEQSEQSIIEQTQTNLEGTGDSYLGNGKTQEIINTVTDDSLTSKEAADRVVDLTPTGLPGPVDRVVKDVAKKLCGGFVQAIESSDGSH